MRGIRNKPTKSDLDWMNKSKATKIFELFASQELFYNGVMLTDAFNPPHCFPHSRQEWPHLPFHSEVHLASHLLNSLAPPCSGAKRLKKRKD